MWIETLVASIGALILLVTPHVGVWIETDIQTDSSANGGVTPHVGVWIETVARVPAPQVAVSHLM